MKKEVKAEEKIINITFGRVRLCTKSEGYATKFDRFKGDKLNGWTQLKAELYGKEGDVIKTYGDKTVTIKFDDDSTQDFPMEAVATQLSETADPFSTVNIKKIRVGRIRLCSNEEGYQNKFWRFLGDDVNGWVPKKKDLAGMEGQVTETFENHTVTVMFDDGSKFNFPMEAIAH